MLSEFMGFHSVDALLDLAINSLPTKELSDDLSENVSLTTKLLTGFLGVLRITGFERSLKVLMKRLHKPVYEKRLGELVRCITPLLRANDFVLDVGCGIGALGSALVRSPMCPAGVRIRGLERIRRDRNLIQIDTYDGIRMPYPANTYDVVILADVLHHEQQPEKLFWECLRVSKRLIIIKDHRRTGLLAQQRVSLLDWAANFADAVPCTFRYNTPAQWGEFHRRHGLALIEERCSMDLYPSGLNLIFGGRLQYLAVLDTSNTSVADSHDLVNDCVMTRTVDGIISFWNHSAEKLYGWRKEEAVGKVSHDLLQTQFPKPLQDIESELVRNGRWEGKLVHTTRNGVHVVVESRWTLHLNEPSEAVVETNRPQHRSETPTSQSFS